MSKEIKINDPKIVEVKDLPLVVELPDDASEGQKEYAKMINSYAYQNPTKFALKKDAMLKKLKSLTGKPKAKKKTNVTIKKADSPVEVEE